MMYTVTFKKRIADENAATYKKHAWPIIGAAWENENGSITVKLDSIPINWNGELMLFPEKEK